MSQPIRRRCTRAAVAVLATTSLASCALFKPKEEEGTLRAESVVAVTASNRLVTFNAGRPQRITASVAVTGLEAGEGLLGIDFRPANGKLYAAGTTGRLYMIDATTGAASAVGAGNYFAANVAGDSGFDFNPAVDRIRFVNERGENLRLHPDTGAVVDGDANAPGLQIDGRLSYAAGDRNAGRAPRIVAAGYTNSIAGAKVTTNFAIDAAAGTLVTQGTMQGAPSPVSPNTGQLFTVGALGVKLDGGAVSFDISPANEGFVSLPNGKGSRFYTIDLSTGAATDLGRIGVDEPVRAIAIRP